MYQRHILAITFILLLFVSCTRQQPAAPEQKALVPAAPVPAAKPDWQARWDSLTAQARKEGKVSVYALWRPETRDSIGKAFRDKFGITLDYTAFGRGAELLAKVQAEKRAGLYLADAFGAGGPTLIATMKPVEVLGSIEPVLILPEVMDGKLWSSAQVPFLDKDKKAIGMIASVQRYILYNTDMVKAGEITTYKDVLNPRYKDKITLNDPSVTGVGNAFLSHLAYHLWSIEEATDFLKQLIRQQNAVIQRDNRLHIDSVARGKYAIGLAPLPDVLEEFLAAGTPVAAPILKEGTFVSPAAGALAVPTNFGNPSAARVFVNWLLSKEGQTIFSRSFASPSLRNDVSTEGIRPIFLPQPGEKLYLDSEELILLRGQMQGIAKKTMEEAMK